MAGGGLAQVRNTFSRDLSVNLDHKRQGLLLNGRLLEGTNALIRK